MFKTAAGAHVQMHFRGTTGKMVQGLKRPGIWCVDFASGSALSSPASNVVGYCLRPGSALLSYDAAGADVSLMETMFTTNFCVQKVLLMCTVHVSECLSRLR